ncbi:MAG TPA: VIT and VWA domain-containing protein [Longimicrobiales bacterium]|nr:VIT and VWA domain-containing protein [Longimicrobiales bacterium]
MRSRAESARSAAWVVALLLSMSGGLHAQGWIEPGRPGAFAVVKLRTNVRVTVHERVAQVEVEEWFRNDGPPFGEADYLYPLPAGASFTNYSLWQGDEELRGEMMDAGEARRIYEEIVRSKRDPALIELVGHGLMRARVFPIGTGETRRIALRYTQVLPRAGNALEFRYAAGSRAGGTLVAPPVRPLPMPMPRPIEPDQRVEHPETAGRPHPDGAPLTFTLTVAEGARFRDPFSPTHRVRVARERGRLTVASAERLAGDFALYLPFADQPVGITVATHRPVRSEDGYFMVTLSPASVASARVPRDITAVVDVSGSMSGEKLDQARRALHHLLGTLDAHDRIRLIRFHGSVASWREGWAEATPAALREARAWVDGLRAEGGTNIAGALTEAFAAGTPAQRLGVVVFLTDGLPSVGERDPERIAELAERERGSARVFAFGVGYDVNTYLLDRLSAAARGTTQYVGPEEDVERAVATLAARIRHPVLTDLALEVAGARIAEVYPRELPDLFADEELVIFGRYTPSERSTIALTGRRAGRAESYRTAASFARHEPGNDWLPRLWATRRIGQLTRELRLHGHSDELVEEIRRTALRYGVLSEYTAYLVQEPGVIAGNPALRNQAAFAAAPAAATGERAVASAKSAQRQRDVTSAAELRVMEREQADAAVGAGGRARAVQGRTFVLEDGVWEDALSRTGLRVVHVRAFSAAYFALLAALPELVPYARELADVQVSGSRVLVRITGDGGVEQLGSADLARAVTEFRGAKATR